jgi:hypothetical protein
MDFLSLLSLRNRVNCIAKPCLDTNLYLYLSYNTYIHTTIAPIFLTKLT